MSVIEEPRALAYCYTAGGRKLHLAWDDQARTLCGFDAWQLVLVEEPVPINAICDWCRAARDKETP